MGVAAIKQGRAKELRLGNLDAKRDWGYARDYVEAMWRILQQKKPGDFVIATGVQHSVREFVEAAAAELGMKIRWRGKGAAEKGYDARGRAVVAVDPRYYRPAEVDTLLGDAAKARRQLKWKPRVAFRELVAEMAREDLRAAERDALISRHGFRAVRGRE
jgi:GDPmannose 4,6-dehydratase